MIKKSEAVSVGKISVGDFLEDPENLEENLVIHYGRALYAAFVDTFSKLLMDMLEVKDNVPIGDEPDLQVLFSVNFYLDEEGCVIAQSDGYKE